MITIDTLLQVFYDQESHPDNLANVNQKIIELSHDVLPQSWHHISQLQVAELVRWSTIYCCAAQLITSHLNDINKFLTNENVLASDWFNQAINQDIRWATCAGALLDSKPMGWNSFFKQMLSDKISSLPQVVTQLTLLLSKGNQRAGMVLSTYFLRREVPNNLAPTVGRTLVNYWQQENSKLDMKTPYAAYHHNLLTTCLDKFKPYQSIQQSKNSEPSDTEHEAMHYLY